MNKKLRVIFKQTVFALIIAAFMATPIAEARGYENLSVDQLARMGIYFTKGDFSCGATSAAATSGAASGGNQALNLSAHQLSNAKVIIGIAKTYNLGKEGALIGVMTAITESHLRSYASQRIPISEQNPMWKALPPSDKKSGRDHMSVGAFQQQVTTGWSTYGNSPSSQATVWQLMDIAYNAQAFFGTPKGSKLPADLKQPSALRKGLQNLKDWKNYEPWIAAQNVQISFDPRGLNYKKSLPEAQKIIDQYYDSSPAVPLPIAVNGGEAATPGGAVAANGCPTDAAANGTAVQKMMATIAKYAWPDYCSQGSGNCKNRSSNCPRTNNYCGTPNEMRKAYVDAITAAKKKGDYIGSCHGVDCGGFVSRVMRDSGADTEYNKYQGNTAAQMQYMRDYSDTSERKDGKPIRYHRVKGSEKLQSGDIAVRNNGSSGHTYFYVGKITGLDEQGKVVPFNGAVASASQCGRAPMASGNDDRDKYEWYRLITK